MFRVVCQAHQMGAPGIVDITIHPQQDRIVLELCLKHAVDDQAGPLLQPIAIVLIGDAGQDLCNAACTHQG